MERSPGGFWAASRAVQMVEHGFRCYVYQAAHGRYQADCLDLTLMGEGETPQQAMARSARGHSELPRGGAGQRRRSKHLYSRLSKFAPRVSHHFTTQYPSSML